jgi:acetyl-CoA carboxylase biotin carboxyl carrier protein
MSENVGSARAEDKKEQNARRGRQNQKQKRKQTEPSLNMSELRELSELIDQYGFTDFEFENENIRVRMSKNPAPQIVQAFQPMQAAPQMSASSAPTSAPPQTAETSAAPEADIDSDAGLHKITSPIVGTFYRSPSPDKEPYVKEGSQVSPDTTVCIVEAMKLMNEIQAEVSGEVVKIYVENGQPVEYGQPLFGIKK